MFLKEIMCQNDTKPHRPQRTAAVNTRTLRLTSTVRSCTTGGGKEKISLVYHSLSFFIIVENWIFLFIQSPSLRLGQWSQLTIFLQNILML